jgi:hypothetical protein
MVSIEGSFVAALPAINELEFEGLKDPDEASHNGTTRDNPCNLPLKFECGCRIAYVLPNSFNP